MQPGSETKHVQMILLEYRRRVSPDGLGLLIENNKPEATIVETKRDIREALSNQEQLKKYISAAKVLGIRTFLLILKSHSVNGPKLRNLVQALLDSNLVAGPSVRVVIATGSFPKLKVLFDSEHYLDDAEIYVQGLCYYS